MNLRYSGLGSASTSIDVHVGNPYETGPATVHISDGGSTSEVLDGSVPWPASMRDYVQDCVLPIYLEVDTVNFPSGELRGPFVCEPVPVAPTTWGRLRTIYR